jgi:hypothetical protein
MFKVKKALILTTAVLLVTLSFSACGRKGELNPNVGPTIRITSYEGVIDSTAVDTDNPALFQQKIYWEANDADGVVESYAYRVVDKDGNPYPNGTPGHNVVDEEGWIYHYNDGADQSIPLAETDQKSIWTNDVYTIINFPANIDGDSAVVVSRFDVKCKDNDGNNSIAVDQDGVAISPNSEYASKYFSAYSLAPGVSISSTKGNLNGAQIGRGIVFQFSIMDSDPYVGSVPDYFKFRLEKRDLLGRIISEAEGGYPDTEYTTKNQANVSRFLMTEFTEPSLLFNTYESGSPIDSTYIIVKSVDLAGIESEEEEVGFAVRDGFYPGTIIFNGAVDANKNAIYALGDNHYTTFIAEQIPTILPSTLTVEGTHFATPFWIDNNGDYSVIGSNNLSIYMKWGYKGQYESDNPNNKKIGTVIDELTNLEYFSEVRYYDLRLDGEAFVYAPLPAVDYNVVDEDTGKEWLRVPVNANIAEDVTLTGLDIGTHKFEVRAVDLQDVADKTPAVMIFNIVDPTPISEKSGILVIDDDADNSLPDDMMDAFYVEALSDYTGTIDFMDRNENESPNFKLHFSKASLPATELVKYKTIIYHSENKKDSGFWKEYDAMNLYLNSGGNVILSTNSNLSNTIMLNSRKEGFNLISRYFGVSVDNEESTKTLPKTPQDPILEFKPLFHYAVKAANMTADLDLQRNESILSFIDNHPITQIAVDAHGLISYFDEDLLLDGTEVLYRLGCKEVGDGIYDPSLDEINTYGNQPIAIRKLTDSNKCYLFSFPLSFMKADQAKIMFNQIMSEIETTIEN